MPKKKKKINQDERALREQKKILNVEKRRVRVNDKLGFQAVPTGRFTTAQITILSGPKRRRTASSSISQSPRGKTMTSSTSQSPMKMKKGRK
jgi:hypothetical protein